MGKLVSIFRDTYIRFMVWLGAEAPAGYEHYLPDEDRPREYTLQEGETIFSVARKFGVHYDRIARANDIEELDSVQAGQTLVIPPANWEPDTEPEDENLEPPADEPDTGIETEEDDIPSSPPEPPDEIIPPIEEIPDAEPIDWLAEVEQTSEAISSTEEPTLLPDETELPTELPDEAPSTDEPEWLLSAEPALEIAAADSLSVADSVTLDEDVEWLVATEPQAPAKELPSEEAPAVQEELPFESPATPAEEPPPIEIPAEREATSTPVSPELPLDEEMTFRYEVQRGDTLSSIAKHYSVTMMELLDANDIADPSRIFPGLKLVIPGYLASKSEEIEPEEPSPEPLPPPSSEFFVYAVIEGDTISSIAKRYGVTLRELVEVNNIDESNLLWVGQRLYIPGILQQTNKQEKTEITPAPPTIEDIAPQPSLVTDPNFPPVGPLDAIRALYLSYFAVGHGDSLTRMFRLLNNTEFNAVVIDVKGEHGWLSYPSQIPQAYGIDPAHPTAKDFEVVMRELKARGIYTIARIVTFKDHPLATSRSDLSLKTSTGSVWQDRDNTSWSDPFLKPVWDYNIQIAIEAAQKGFDEIQFDYLRFPNASQAGTPQYSQEITKETRVAAVTGFLSAAKGQLERFGVKIAADTFGYTCWRKDDTLIGQDIERMAQYLDILSPKLYPSSFGNGIPQYKIAVAHPYEVVFESAQRAVERVQKYGCGVRPWLQDFPDYRFDKRVYGKEEIQAQIKGSFDAGANGFMVWNPDVKYTDNAYAPVSKA